MLISNHNIINEQKTEAFNKKEINNKIEDINRIEDINKIKKVDKNDIENEKKYEVKIDNIGFSYNKEAKELVVRVERDNKIYQYPSDEILKLKKYLMEQNI